MLKCVDDSCCQIEIPFEFLDVHNHPTVTDLQKNMGKDLTDVYLKTCTPIERTLFGRDKSLKGPGKLWINPADRLSGEKVQLTPSHTECLQAFTHQGILEIGEKLARKFDESNQLMIEQAVAEAEELADFEANQKIKFYVETEALKLNEQWHKRLNDLTAQHEDEKKCLKRIYEDARELLKSFIEEKCRLETEELLCKAVKDTTIELEQKCSLEVDRELAQQWTLFEEQMENTLNNLAINDRQRMEEMKVQCLRAMDLQIHLMSVRQISELMQLMAVEKQFRKSKLQNMQTDLAADEALSERETTSTPVQDNQSKSIKRLWIEFLQKVDDFAGEKLDGDEIKILREIHHVRVKMMKPTRNYDGTLTIPSSVRDNPPDQADANESPQIIRNLNERQSNGSDRFIDVAWEKIENNGSESDTDDSFSMHALKQFLQPQNSLHPEIASSIKNVMKKVNELQLGKNMTKIIHDTMLQEFASVNSMGQAFDFIPMPKTDVVTIRDSLKVMEKRVSLQEDQEPIETPLLISTVDSLELVSLHSDGSRPGSKRTSKERGTKPVQCRTQSLPTIIDQTANLAQQRSSRLTKLPSSVSPKHTSHEIQVLTPTVPSPTRASPSTSSHLPPYMKMPSKVCTNYARMSTEDWNNLKTPRRRTTFSESAIQFDNEPEVGRKSQKLSILHRSVSEEKENPQSEQDAMFSIQKKCREALNDMNVESLLMMLCDDDDKSNVIDDA